MAQGPDANAAGNGATHTQNADRDRAKQRGGTDPSTTVAARGPEQSWNRAGHSTGLYQVAGVIAVGLVTQDTDDWYIYNIASSLSIQYRVP